MKVTKTTIKRINAHSSINKKNYRAEIWVIANILCRAAVIIGDSGRYEVNDGSWDLLQPWILSDGDREFVSSQVLGEYEKRNCQRSFYKISELDFCFIDSRS